MEFCFACTSTEVKCPHIGLEDTLFESRATVNYIENLIDSLTTFNTALDIEDP